MGTREVLFLFLYTSIEFRIMESDWCRKWSRTLVREILFIPPKHDEDPPISVVLLSHTQIFRYNSELVRNWLGG